MEVEEIITALDANPEVYQRAAVQAAMDRRDEVVPLLLAQLERAIREPDAVAASDSMILYYAVYLLAYHRVQEAHLPLIALASLPGEMPLDLLGDTITDGLDILLWKTSAGDATNIERLIENRGANAYSRIAGMGALVHGVTEKAFAREEVVALLRRLLVRDDALEDDLLVCDGAACFLADLWPGETMDVLRSGIERGIIEQYSIEWSSVEAAFKAGKEAQLAMLEQRSLAALRADPHEAMESWACFHPEASLLPLPLSLLQPRSAKKQAETARENARKKKSGSGTESSERGIGDAANGKRCRREAIAGGGCGRPRSTRICSPARPACGAHSFRNDEASSWVSGCWRRASSVVSSVPGCGLRPALLVRNLRASGPLTREPSLLQSGRSRAGSTPASWPWLARPAISPDVLILPRCALASALQVTEVERRDCLVAVVSEWQRWAGEGGPDRPSFPQIRHLRRFWPPIRLNSPLSRPLFAQMAVSGAIMAGLSGISRPDSR
ncbi:MAG: DUF1186 domain-containing protein [Candidatus Schekmanbacteria bacterium]|nr:DUF1186 domain-containing protein [Candidatus Schekmanbacteria bacterium]